jgi:hypothetical protein
MSGCDGFADLESGSPGASTGRFKPTGIRVSVSGCTWTQNDRYSIYISSGSYLRLEASQLSQMPWTGIVIPAEGFSS